MAIFPYSCRILSVPIKTLRGRFSYPITLVLVLVLDHEAYVFLLFILRLFILSRDFKLLRVCVMLDFHRAVWHGIL